MTQRQLNEAVAHKLGESVGEVQRLGFSLADPVDVNFDPEPCDLEPQIVDWDALALARCVPYFV
jgi:hypothetical protein